MSNKTDAELIVVGGGAVGCGVAYALAGAGKTDVLVLERADQLGQVTTSQGAGLCGQARSSVERIRLAMKSVEIFRELQRDPEVQPDWNEAGSLRIALTDQRLKEFRALKKTCDEAGLEVDFISHETASSMWPMMDFSSVKGILFCPTDGTMKPQSVVNAYAHQCRRMGVEFETSAEVTGVMIENGRVKGVQTQSGPRYCETLINAAGAHAYHLARMAGLELPIVPVRHEYFVTAQVGGLRSDMPSFRIPDLTLYGRVRDGGLLLGGWESRARHLAPQEIPADQRMPEIDSDWAVLNRFAKDFSVLIPESRQGEKTFVGKGWPTFTPDGRFIIGESRLVKGFFMAGGCNAHGISGSGGIGALVIEALLDPDPRPYVRSLSPDRFTETDWTWKRAEEEARSIYETYYGSNSG